MSYKMNFTAEEKIKLSRDDSVEKLYQRTNQRTVKVITVMSYILFVSFAAIVLSLYYVFLWDPSASTLKNSLAKITTNCDNNKIIIPENLAIRLINSTEVSAEQFYNSIIKTLQLQNEKDSIETINSPQFEKYFSMQTHTEEHLMTDGKIRMNHDKKKIQDDEDLDFESSGEKLMTTINPPKTENSSADPNDTTMVFDQDES